MDIGPLLARSANARDTASATRRDSRDETGESSWTEISQLPGFIRRNLESKIYEGF